MTRVSYMRPSNLPCTTNKSSFASIHFYFFFVMVISQVKNKPDSYL